MSIEAARRETTDDAPQGEPMRGSRRRGREKPTREDLKVRRRQQRAQAPIQPRTATLRCLACESVAPGRDRCPACSSLAVEANFWDTENIKPHERVSNWKDIVGDHDTSDWRIHRTIHIDPMDDPDGFRLWKGMSHDPVKGQGLPDHEVAHRLLSLVTDHPHLGLHWTADERHAIRVGGQQGWGHGQSWYSGQGQGHSERSGLESPVIVHARWPKTEHIETDPEVLHRYGVKPFDNPDLDEHNEAEVPMKTGAPIEITGLSWSNHTSNRPGEYRHYTFDEPIKHTASKSTLVLDCAACGHLTRAAFKRCRACGSLAFKTATVLMTQIERANPGDLMRTPQGQNVKIKKVRPHETENGKVYVDTDLGTSIMDRGTDVNLVQGERQRELPDSGNPMGNSGQLPGAGRTPTGEGATMTGRPAQMAAPDCPRDGTKMVLKGNTWVCPVDGTTAPTTAAPGGMQPTDRPSGQVVEREKGRRPPQTHLWASYHTAGRPPAIVRRAQEVLDTMEETRS